MTKDEAKKILDFAIKQTIFDIAIQEPTIPCFICGEEADMMGTDFYIDEHELRIEKPICENCYDNVRHEVIDVLEEDEDVLEEDETEVKISLDNLVEGVDYYKTGTGQILTNIHKEEDCKGSPCLIHNPSNHIMRDFPTHWRDDRRIMERICPHGVGHPDPDDIKVRTDEWEGVHGCDGCCSGTGPK